LAERHGADFGAFSFNGEIVALKIDLVHAQRHEFGDPQAGRIEQLEHRLVACAERPGRVWVMDQLSNIIARQGLWKFFRCACEQELRNRIRGEQSLSL
jgi:hypothetical protein